ncbi:MAG: DUF6147 family protein [Eubacteriales bacterium]|nr:DUF6147 family protein [Eubacteriales bacterium]
MERSESTNRRKKIGTVVLAGMLSLNMILPVSAVQASSILDEITETETSEDFSEDTSYSLLRSNNLAYGSAKISKLSSNEINIYGLTQCHHECDNVYLYLYLEQKEDGSYATYKYWRFELDDATSLSRSINVIVPSNHYYRVRGYHAAKDGGTKESTTTLTSGILVK